MIRLHIILITLIFPIIIKGQSAADPAISKQPNLFQFNASWIDSVRLRYKMPELGCAVVSSDSILLMSVTGVQNIKTKQKASLNDRFRIGSNTKTVTSFIAALLEKEGKIKYETKFFDLFPELKEQSDPACLNITLQDLLTFRANLISWTYTNTKPTVKEVYGNARQQRYMFISWVLRQPPAAARKEIYWSNPGYVAAGLMLEKASGKSYEELVKELGESIGIDFQFGQPNFTDANQPWGHNDHLEPEEPANSYKLNWLSSAGNLNVNLPDYSKFIQMQLAGLQGKSALLSAQEFQAMHFALPAFSYGWQSYEDEESHLKYSCHKGNPGTFLSQVFICPKTDRAYILFTNVQSESAEEGLSVIFHQLKKTF